MKDPAGRSQRGAHQLRSVTFERGVMPYAEGSCLVSFGRTRVLCTASVQEGVPDWRRDSGSGWLTAEYSMLPRATHTRTARERARTGGRTLEIQRLIGRALRAATELDVLGAHTITVDCDVLVADGGTRTAAVTGAALSVHDACAKLLAQGRVESNALRELVAGISVGIVGGENRLDLEYAEDVAADVDMNLIALESGNIVEIQGTAEGASFSHAQLDMLVEMGLKGISRLVDLQRQALGRKT